MHLFENWRSALAAGTTILLDTVHAWGAGHNHHGSLNPAVHRLPPPSEWARTALGFQPDPTQAAVLDTQDRRVLLCCSRQWGKSTITAIRALHFAHQEPGATVLCVAPTLRQSGLLLDRIQRLLPKPAPRDPRDPHSLRLPNGSAIIALPAVEDNIRGFDNVGFLIVDEAAMVADEVYTATRPMRALCDGHLWLISTPHGQHGFFYDAWHSDTEHWARFQAKATDCPRLTPEFLAEERLSLGPQRFAQEYLCDFLPGEGQWIPIHLIDGAVTPAEEPLMPESGTNPGTLPDGGARP